MRQKSWNRSEKCESEILVNGSNLARVYRKAEPQVVIGELATASSLAEKTKLLK